MSEIPDLVLDSKLETQFLPDCSVRTAHTYREPDPEYRTRLAVRVEHWRRQGKLGSGAYGSVWLEECIEGQPTAKLRAVKQIDLNRRSARIDYNRELEAIAKFSQPKYARCFVKSFGWYDSPHHLLIAMEYVEKGDLRGYLHRRPALPERDAGEIVFQILDGLNMMHGNKFAHRDLKPENILIQSQPPEEWWIKISDFGISKRVGEDPSASTALQGTPGYIAPELYQIVEQGTPYASDIWAVGQILFELLTKKTAFSQVISLIQYVTGKEKLPIDRLSDFGSSAACGDMLSALMCPHSNDRITAHVAISHQWIKSKIDHLSNVSSESTSETQIIPTVSTVTESYASWNTAVPSTILDSANSQSTTSDVPFLSRSEQAHIESSNTNQEHAQVAHVASSNTDFTSTILGSTIDRSTLSDVPPFPREQQARIEPVKADQVHAQGTQAYKRMEWSIGSRVEGFFFSGDDKALIAAGGSSIDAWSPSDRAPTGGVFQSENHGSLFQIFGVALSPDTRCLAFGDMYSRLNFLEFQPETQFQTHLMKTYRFERAMGVFEAVVFSPNGKMVACYAGDWVAIWDVSQMKEVESFKLRTDSEVSRTYRSIAFSPDSSHLMYLSDPRNLRFQRVGSNTRSHNDIRLSLNAIITRFSPDGKHMAFTSDMPGKLFIMQTAQDGAVRRSSSTTFFMRPKEQFFTKMTEHFREFTISHARDSQNDYYHTSHRIECMDFSPDGRLLAVFFQCPKHGNRQIVLLSVDERSGPWPPKLQELSRIIDSGESETNLNASSLGKVAFSHDGTSFASLRDGEVIKLWNTISGVPFRELGQKEVGSCVK